MDIRVSGHQVETGAALQAHAEERLTGVVGKYFSRALSSQVTLGKGPHGGFRCDIVTHVTQGLILKGSAIAQDAHAAVDQSAEKIDKQLRRYKRRLKDHHKDRVEPVAFEAAGMYVLAADEDEWETQEDGLQPMIIAEMETRVPTLSVGEAVMQMELSGSPLLVFRNEKHGGVNVVHRRDDGNVGWIDPRNLS